MGLDWESDDDAVLLPFFEDGRASVQALLSDKRHSWENIWIYFSPKNGFRRHVALHNLGYIRALLAEADLRVVSYTPKTTEVLYVDESGRQRKAAASLVLQEVDGPVWETIVADGDSGATSSLARDALAEAAKRAGARYRVFTENDLVVRNREGKAVGNRDREIENWGVLVPIMARGRPTRYVLNHEMDTITRLLNEHKKVSVSDLLSEPCVDPGRMLASIGLAVQRGQIKTDLESRRFSLSSSITWRGSATRCM